MRLTSNNCIYWTGDVAVTLETTVTTGKLRNPTWERWGSWTRGVARLETRDMRRCNAEGWEAGLGNRNQWYRKW
jgi:hypothetical protein